MTISMLEPTATSNSQSEESIQIPISPYAARVLNDTNAITTIHSTSSSAETINLFLESIDSLRETLDILNDANLMESLQRGMRESTEGKGQDLDDVLEELGW